MALLLFQVMFLAGLVATCASGEEETTTSTMTTAMTTAALDEAGKSKRTVEEQLGYGHNDLQQQQRPQPRRVVVVHPQRDAFYPQPEYFPQPSPQATYQQPQPHLYEAYRNSPRRGYSSVPALSSPVPWFLPGAQFIPVIILRLHDSGAGPQVAQAIPALLHSPPPPTTFPLQALLPQYQPAETYQPADKVVYIAPPALKPAFVGKKQPQGPALPRSKPHKFQQLPEQEDPSYKFGDYKDKPQ